MYKNISELPIKGTSGRRIKKNAFNAEETAKINYKNVQMLQKYLSERGKIIPSRVTAVSSKMQRKLAKAIKRSRYMGLLPYIK